MSINELKERIQKLISKVDNWANRSKNLNRLLYQQLYEVIELERLEKLEGKFLQAYLLWKSIMRANYQPNLLNISPNDKEKLLEAIETEVNSIEKNNQRQISNELTDEELKEELGRRIWEDRFFNSKKEDHIVNQEDDYFKIELFFNKKAEVKTPWKKINLKS